MNLKDGEEENTEQTEITEQTEGFRLVLVLFRLFRYFRLFRILSSCFLNHSLNAIHSLVLPFCLLSLIVCLAIIRSSLVLMTRTLTRLSAAEITGAAA